MAKLAEALIERAAIQKKLAELKQQISHNIQVEKDESPEEKIEDLMAVFEQLTNKLADIVARINITNSTSTVSEGGYDGMSIMQLLAKRDSVAQVKNQWLSLANEHSERDAYGRSKDDIKYVLTFSPKSARSKADAFAKEHRELDVLIQGLNWKVDLI